jgi:glycosyltransferase involved in cell wall biosynthesis
MGAAQRVKDEEVSPDAVTTPEDARPLRVLMVHNHYLIRGGEDVSFAAEAELLREAGHHVETYVRDNTEVSDRGSLLTAADALWSRRSRRDVAEILRRDTYDVMHVQNFFPLVSPSVYGAAREAGVAVVQSLRNYRLLCAGGLFLREGRTCELCHGKAFGWQGIRHKCYRDDRAGSTVVAAMAAWHRARGTWLGEVDRFIVASTIALRKFTEAGFPAERFRLKPNVMPDLPDLKPAARQTRAIYVGRLSREKGVRPIVEAWVAGKLQIPLLIVGTGPLEVELRNAAKANPAIEFTGRLRFGDTCRAIAESKLLLLPSQCYETFGRTVLEAYAMGTPVISSRGTAPGDLIEDGRTGFLVDPGDAAGLERCVRDFFALPAEKRRAMGEEARKSYQTNYNRERNLEILVSVYREAIAAARTRAARAN